MFRRYKLAITIERDRLWKPSFHERISLTWVQCLVEVKLRLGKDMINLYLHGSAYYICHEADNVVGSDLVTEAKEPTFLYSSMDGCAS